MKSNTAMNTFKKGLLTKYFLFLLLLATPVAFAGSVPYTFTSGTSISSTEVNANFSDLAGKSWDLSGSNISYSAGSVGIGSTSPGAQFDVKGFLSTALTGTVTVTASSTTVTGTSTTFTSELNAGDSIKIGSEIFTVSSIASDTSLTLDSAHSAGASGVTAYRDGNLMKVQNGDGVGQLFVDKSGNVGIGTTSPNQKLHIKNGQIFIEGTGANIYLQPGTGNTAQVGTSNTGEKLNIIGASDITFSTWTSGWTNRVYISNSGNVGIGTTSPSGALDVTSTSGGFLVPRMTTTQRSALTAVNGMIVYDSTLNAFYFYENGSWVTK